MKLKLSILAMLVGGAIAASSAMAGQIKINYSDAGHFNGTLTPTTPSSTVWATALFEDTAVAGKVKLTMTVSALLAGNSSYVRDWYFNVLGNPALTFLNTDAPTAVPTYGSNCCQVNGPSGNFDLLFRFSSANPGNLAQGANSIFEITGIGLTAASFNQLTPLEGGGRGGFLSAVKVQGDGISYDVRGVLDDGRVEEQGDVPEPGTLALIGLGLLGAAATRRRR